MIHVKICGITNLNDALFSAEAGADALGFNFYRKSPRFVEPAVAGKIAGQLPEGVSKVGVFVNEPIELLISSVECAGVDTVQLHGDEDGEFVSNLKARTNLRIIKALRVASEIDLRSVVDSDADAFLLDYYDPFLYGGTGRIADWNVAARFRERINRLYLAGGLDPDNVAEAIKKVRPFAVDAASGLEAEKGRKDHDKIVAFIRNAKGA